MGRINNYWFLPVLATRDCDRDRDRNLSTPPPKHVTQVLRGYPYLA